MKPTGVLMVLSLLSLAGCASQYRFDTVTPQNPTLLVINRGLNPVRVYGEFSHVPLVRVMPGMSQCTTIQGAMVRQIIMRDGAKWSRTPEFTAFSAEGWVIEVGRSPTLDALTLRPAARCK